MLELNRNNYHVCFALFCFYFWVGVGGIHFQNYQKVYLLHIPWKILQKILKEISNLIVKLLISVDGGWDKWSVWSKCSVTCGGGTHERYRSCTNPAPQHGGADCTGQDVMSEACNTNNCPSE